MSRLIAIIKTEPVMITGLVQALLAFAIATGWHLTTAEGAGIIAATTAILALVAAVATRPFQVSALTGAVTAVVTLLVAFGVPHIQLGDVATLNAVIVAVMTLVLRLHVTPVATLNEQAIKSLAAPLRAPLA